MTSIEWTNRPGTKGETWNPVTGCTKVSPGCKHCYAERLTERFGRQKFTDILIHEDRLDKPLRWREPRTVFVNSMSDMFHEDVPDEFIDRVFAVMALSPRHTFQILTKRADRMASYLTASTSNGAVREIAVCATAQGMPYKHRGEWAEFRWMGWPLPNVWLGVSVEDQRRADERIPLLLQAPAAVRFLSVEPLLEGIGLGLYLLEALGPIRGREQWRPEGRGIDWVIIGGESGPGARPCNVEWIRSIVGQCREAGVACFVKQLGSRWARLMQVGNAWDRPRSANRYDPKGGDPSEWPEDLRIREFPA